MSYPIRTKPILKVIIAGSRSFDDYDTLEEVCKEILAEYWDHRNIVIISGGAAGADYQGEVFAYQNQLSLSTFKAQWKQYGKVAGHLRNEVMAKEADMLIAFWDGASKGTENMIKLARKHNLEYYVHMIKGES